MTLGEKFEKVADAVYDKGSKYIEDMITNKGTRTGYANGFAHSDFSGYRFSREIRPTGNVEKMFYSYQGTELPQNINLSDINATQGSYHDLLFANSPNLKKANDLFISPYGILLKYNRTFYNCPNLEEIVYTLYISDKTIFNNTFYNCKSLKDVGFYGGRIGTNIDLSYSPLLKGTVVVDLLRKLVDYANTAREGIYSVLLTEESWKAANDYKPPSWYFDAYPTNDWKEYANMRGWLT